MVFPRGRVLSACVAVLFILALWMPMLQMWRLVFPEKASSEKRVPAQRPVPDLRAPLRLAKH